MKHLLVIKLLIITIYSPVINSQPAPRLPAPNKIACDEQYAVEMQSVLKQFSWFTDARTLRLYQDFMVMIKQYEDLGYLKRPFERSLTSEQRALVRTPMQHYNDCRVGFGATFGYGFQQQSPPKALLTPCEVGYARESQLVLNRYLLFPNIFSEVETYLLILKQFEDLAWKISDFEKKFGTTVVSRLRSAMRRYENCKDAILRGTQPPPSVLPVK